MEYLHGFSKEEQNRLIHQAKFLAPLVYRQVDFSQAKSVLEIGCGVGAQTKILCEKFKNTQFTCLEQNVKQIETAKENLKDEMASGQVKIIHSNSAKLDFETDTFDGAFFCWILEHVTQPLQILAETHRVLKKGARVFINEVNNATLYLNPYAPATLKYWFEFNDHQYNLHGDPFVGAKLGNLLTECRYKDILTESVILHLDNRQPKARQEYCDYFKTLFLSGAPELLKNNLIKEDLINAMQAEWDLVKSHSDGVIYFSWMFGSCTK